MINFTVATTNKHKVEELEVLLKDAPLKITRAEKKFDVVEDADTFEGNALKKAKTYFEHLKTPTISDDSGLVVEALPNELGIYSARFGGEGLTDRDRCHLLLEKMEGVDNRKAYFTCTLCFYLGLEEYYFFEGRLQGEIARELKGDKGFGYDPLFIPEKNNQFHLAEIPDWKNQYSHRGVSSAMAVKFFRGFRDFPA